MKAPIHGQTGQSWQLHRSSLSRRHLQALLATLCLIGLVTPTIVRAVDAEYRGVSSAAEAKAQPNENKKARKARINKGPITVEFQAGSANDSIFIRSRDTHLTDPTVAASAKAFLFNFAGHRAKNTDIPVDGKRLAKIRIRQHSGRVGVRLVQRDDAKGSLRKHVSHKRIDGGIKVTVRHDLNAAPAELVDAAQPSATKGQQHAEQLAALLGTDSASTAESGAKLDPDRSRAQPALDSSAAAADSRSAQSEGKAEVNDQTYLAQPLDLASKAAKPGPETLEASSDANSERWFGLALLVALALGAAVLLRWLKTHVRSAATTGGLEVLERMAMGPRSSLLRVRVGTREVLLGQSETGISLLAHLDQGSPIVQPQVASPQSTGSSASATPANTTADWFDPSSAQAPATPELQREAHARIAVFKSRLSAAIAAEHADSDANEDETATRDAEISQNHTHLREVVDEHRPEVGGDHRSISA